MEKTTKTELIGNEIKIRERNLKKKHNTKESEFQMHNDNFRNSTQNLSTQKTTAFSSTNYEKSEHDFSNPKKKGEEKH